MTGKKTAIICFSLLVAGCIEQETPRAPKPLPISPAPTPTPSPSPKPSPNVYAFPLEFTSGTPPVALSNADFLYYPDVAYGEHERQSFDLFLPGKGPASGLVVYYHGGGLVSGDKAQTYELPYLKDRIDDYLWANIAFATVNYRHSNDSFDFSAKTSFRDGARALQFIRHYARDLGLNPSRSVTMGTSAGGAIALYVATRDDLADTQSNDLVQRQSSRVEGAFAYLPQAGYNVPEWKDTVFTPFGDDQLTVEEIYEMAGELNVRSWFGIASLDDLTTSEAVAVGEEVDVLDHISADDPALYISTHYSMDRPSDYATVMHHGSHVVSMMQRGDSVGVDVLAQVPEASIDTTRGVHFYDWSVAKVLAR